MLCSPIHLQNVSKARRPRRWSFVIFAAAALVMLTSAFGETQEPARFRMIDAPSVLIRRLAQGEYRPMRRDEFARLADLLRRQLPDAVFQGAKIEQAVLTARLEDRTLLTGSAAWQLTRTGDQPTWVRFGQPNLAMKEIRWLPTDGQPVAAKIGVFRDQDAMLFVPASGTLQAQWTLTPVETDESLWRYQIELPPAPVNRIDLRLPSNLELSVDVGVARRLELQQDPAAAIQAVDSESVEVWQVDLGGQRRCQLTLKRKDAPEPKAGLRQSNLYQITERGIELVSELNLNCDRTRLSRLELAIDPSLRITRLQHEGRDLTWTRKPGSDGTDDQQAVVVFDPPLEGLNQVVRITAVAPPTLSQRIQLPRVRCEGIDWHQEASRLRMSDRLVPQRLELVGSQQVPEPADAASGTAMQIQSVAIQHVAEDHEVLLSLGREPNRVEYRSATRLRPDEDGLIAEVSVDFRFLTPDQFDLFGQMFDGWTIESVDSATANMIDKWREVTGESRQLAIRLASSPSLAEWQRLTIVARKVVERGPNPIPLRQLVPVMFRGDELRSRHFLQVDDDSLVRVEFQDHGRLKWLAANDLSTDELGLFDTTAELMVIDCDDRALNCTVVIDRPVAEATPLRAKIEVATDVDLRETTERIRIDLRRSGSLAAPFHIRLSQKREVGMRWFVDIGEEAATSSDGTVAAESYSQRELDAERVSDSEHPADEIWRIQWPEYLDRDAVIVGERSWPTRDVEVVSLCRVSEATEQDGRVTITTSPHLSVEYGVPESLTPIALDRPPFRQLARGQRAFRYAPDEDAFFDRSSRLSLTLSPTSEFDTEASPWLTIWRMEISTFLDQAGASHQIADLLVENRGAVSLQMRMPKQATLRQVFVDGQLASFDATDDVVRIPLPSAVRFPRVSVQYDQQSKQRLGIYQSLECSQPEIVAAAVIHRVWKLWAPPAYRLSAHQEQANQRPPVAGPLLWQQKQTPTARLLAGQTAVVNRVLRALGAPGEVNLGRDVGRLSSDLMIDARHLSLYGVTARTELSEDTPVRPGANSLSERDELEPPPRDTETAPSRARGTAASSSASSGRVNRLALDRLRQLGIGLVELDNAVILTTQSRIAKLQRGDASSQRPWGVRLSGHRLIGDRITSLPQLEGVTFVPSHLWNNLPSTWQLSSSELLPYVAAGWNLYELSIENGSRIGLYRHTAFQVFSAAAFLFGVALARLMGRQLWRRAWIATSVFVLLSLFVSSPFELLAWRAAWGTAAGFVLIVLSNLASKESEADEVPPPVFAFFARAGAWLAFFAVLAFCTKPASWAQTVPVERSRDASSLPIEGADVLRDAVDEMPVAAGPVYEVYSPIDAQRAPVGEFLYVPNELRQILQQANPRRPDWVLVRANYRGVLEQSADGRQLELRSISADFDLEVTATASAIEFSLPPDSVDSLADEAYLDGRRIPIQWNRSRSALLLPIRQAGSHHLQLSFDTLTITDEGRATVRLDIPKASEASFVLTSPKDLLPLEVPSALGEIQRREATGELQAAIGPSQQLEVSWPVASVADTSPAIEQLCWLTLDRAEVRLDVQLVIDTRRYREPTVTIEADDRLQFDVDGSDQPLALAFVPDRGSRRMEFRVTEVDEERAVIRLGFIDTFASGLGLVSLPYFEVMGQQVRTSVAVSAAPELVLRVVPGNGQILKSADFAQSWGTEELPDLAYRFEDDVEEWVCQGQQSTAPTQVDWQLAYVLDASETRVVALANVWNESGTAFQQRLEIPSDLTIESIQLLNGGLSPSPNSIRWNRNSGGEVSVFFERPVLGSFRMGIVATLAGQPFGERSLPTIQMVDSVTDSIVVDLFRTHDVRISSPTPERESPPELPSFMRDRLEGTVWQTRWETPGPTVVRNTEVQANRQEFEATLTNQLNRVRGRWEHQLRIDLAIEDGVVDQLKLEIPDDWQDEWQSDEYKLSFQRSPRNGFVHVSITPQSGHFNDGASLQFNSTVPALREGRLLVPNVRLLDDATVERRLLVPESLDSQPIPWRIGPGVEPLEAEVLADIDIKPGYRALRIISSDFEVERIPDENRIGVPFVALTDINLVSGGRDGTNGFGLALFDLQPDGLKQCFVKFPDSLRPLAIAVDDQPWGLGDALDDNFDSKLRRLELPSSRMPQRIAVLFAIDDAQQTDNARYFQRALPVLMMLDDHGDRSVIATRQTVVSIYRPDRQNRRLVSDSSRSEVARLRLINQLDLMEQATQSATEFAETGVQRWFQTWAERLIVAKRDWDADASDGANANVVDQRYAELVPRWQRESLFPRDVESVACSSTAVFSDALGAQREVAYHVADQALTEVRLPSRLVPKDHRPSGLAWCVILFGVGLQFVHRSEGALFSGSAPSAACVAGFMIGVAWWYWLLPSFWGLVIALLSLFIWILLRWRTEL